jgi:hypothetical protein
MSTVLLYAREAALEAVASAIDAYDTVRGMKTDVSEIVARIGRELARDDDEEANGGFELPVEWTPREEALRNDRYAAAGIDDD